MNVVVVHMDDCEQTAIDDRSMPYLSSDPEGSWVRFTNCHLSVPVCYPARATLLRGQRTDHHGQHTNVSAAPPFAMTVHYAAWLAAAGVATGFLGKYLNGWPWGDIAANAPGGWARLYANGDSATYTNPTFYDEAPVLQSPAGYSTDLLSDQATAWLAAAAEPFHLRIDTIAPHAPMEPAARHSTVDAGGATEADDPPAWDVQITDAPAHMTYAPLTAEMRTTLRTNRRDARRTLLAVDEMIEAVITALATRGVLANTAIFVLTDNGNSLGRHRVPFGTGEGNKRRPYNWSTDSLLRVRWPGATNRVEHRLASSTDLVATWLAIGAATAGAPQDGIDMRPLLNLTATASWRSSVESIYRGTDLAAVPTWETVVWRATNGRQWRFTEYGTGETELFAHHDDPHELVNVAAANPSVTAFLSRRLRYLVAASHGQRAA